MTLKSILLSSLIMLFCTTSGLSCVSKNQKIYQDRAKTLDAGEICNRISKILNDNKNMECINDQYSSDEMNIEVVKMQRNDLSVFDLFIIAPSHKQSNYLGKFGYESHKFRIIFMMSFNCKVSIWSYMYEPRFLRGGFEIAKNRSNPNWTHLSTFHGSKTYSDRLRQWLIDLFIEKLR